MNENRILRQLNDYLDYKHSLGFKLKQEETVLMGFANYTLENDYNGPLTMDIVMKWTASGKQSDKTMGRKVEVIRPFSKFVVAFDHEAESIPSLIYKNVHDRPVPYIYTEAETVQLMKECQMLFSSDGIRARTIKTVIGLLWSAGLRPSEPINLLVSDVELERGILHIRETKFSKERFVPLDSSVIQKLIAYKTWIEQILGARSPLDSFFYTTGGKPLKARSLAYAFQKIRPCIDAHPTGYPFVRLYDFRHTMACNTIRRWTEEGIDVNSNLHVLSTYLGHVKPEDTYWYLSATPEMMELCCSKYEDMFGGDCNEI
jgi:integrase/recombinase XerD